MKLTKALTARLPAALVAAAVSLLIPTALRAADHGDAPALAQDQGADIADVFLFMDPNNQAKDKVILIATFHGFITPGEASNFGVFDPAIKYHFEIFNDHVNLDPTVVLAPPSPLANRAKAAYLAKVKANRTIDVTFDARAALDPKLDDPNEVLGGPLQKALRSPLPQKATVTLGGFSRDVTTKKFTGVPTTPPTLSGTSANQTVTPLATGDGDIRFFAGIVDDPFFFDIPGFAAFIKARRETGNFDTGPNGPLTRGRDTFAGYNCLAIALEIPLALIKGSGDLIGADFMTQRPATVANSSLGQKKTSPAFKTIDRMGNPGVNVALVPFNKKNEYNGRTAKIDASLSKLGDIASVLAALGVNVDLAANPLDPKLVTLATIAVLRGDILVLNTTVANTGNNGGSNPETGFGTLGVNGKNGGGRRLTDDTIDTVLSVLAGGPLGDNVPAGQDGKLPGNAFPFLSTPHQPQQATATLDDGTRN